MLSLKRRWGNEEIGNSIKHQKLCAHPLTIKIENWGNSRDIKRGRKKSRSKMRRSRKRMVVVENLILFIVFNMMFHKGKESLLNRAAMCKNANFHACVMWAQLIKNSIILFFCKDMRYALRSQKAMKLWQQRFFFDWDFSQEKKNPIKIILRLTWKF